MFFLVSGKLILQNPSRFWLMLVSVKLDCSKCGDFITFVLRTVFVDELGYTDMRLGVIEPVVISSSHVSSDPNTGPLCPYQDSANANGCYIICPRTVSRPQIQCSDAKQMFEVNIPLLDTKTLFYIEEFSSVTGVFPK